MIYFYDDLVAKTVETIKESYDCADILNDLNRINQAITNIKLYGNWSLPDQLDRELRQKYPCIDNMVAFANSIPVPVPRAKKYYFIIIYDTAIKKELVHSIKEFIKNVD